MGEIKTPLVNQNLNNANTEKHAIYLMMMLLPGFQKFISTTPTNLIAFLLLYDSRLIINKKWIHLAKPLYT
jgi:hypothetical protein